MGYILVKILLKYNSFFYQYNIIIGQTNWKSILYPRKTNLYKIIYCKS